MLHLQMSREQSMDAAQCTVVALLLTMHAGRGGGAGGGSHGSHCYHQEKYSALGLLHMCV